MSWFRREPVAPRPLGCVRCLSRRNPIERVATWIMHGQCRHLLPRIGVCDEDKALIEQGGCHVCGTPPYFTSRTPAEAP